MCHQQSQAISQDFALMTQIYSPSEARQSAGSLLGVIVTSFSKEMLIGHRHQPSVQEKVSIF